MVTPTVIGNGRDTLASFVKQSSCWPQDRPRTPNGGVSDEVSIRARANRAIYYQASLTSRRKARNLADRASPQSIKDGSLP